MSKSKGSNTKSRSFQLSARFIVLQEIDVHISDRLFNSWFKKKGLSCDLFFFLNVSWTRLVPGGTTESTMSSRVVHGNTSPKSLCDRPAETCEHRVRPWKLTSVLCVCVCVCVCVRVCVCALSACALGKNCCWSVERSTEKPVFTCEQLHRKSLLMLYLSLQRVWTLYRHQI